MRVLVTAASRHGATADIARLLAADLVDAGVEAEVVPPEDVESLEAYDGVVIGSGVYAGRWLAPAKDFIHRSAADLAHRPVWLFSSGPLGDPLKPEGDPADVAELMTVSGAREHRVFAGRIDRHELGLGEKLIVAAVRAPDGDFRSPIDIAAWASHIARALLEPAPAR